MQKLLPIQSCEECKFFNDINSTCDLNSERIDDIENIPEHCELQDEIE